MLYDWLAAQFYSNVGFTFACHDAEESRRDLILPWITGSFPPRSPSTTSKLANVSNICGNYDFAPVAHMYKEIQQDLRKMAIALVGVPGPHHPSADFVKEYKNERSHATNESQPLHQLELDEIPLYGETEYEYDDALISLSLRRPDEWG
jgi:hypothetical protein